MRLPSVDPDSWGLFDIRPRDQPTVPGPLEPDGIANTMANKAKDQAIPFRGYRVIHKFGASPVQMAPCERLGMGKRR
jgi:hypothetical protein